MKRLKEACDVSAFGQHLPAEQIQRSGVLRRLADGTTVDPSSVAALLPQEQFAAWCQFSQVENPSAEQLTAVLEAATTLEDPATVSKASHTLAQIIRASFRKDLPGSPLERLRSIPSGEPSVAAADCGSTAPSFQLPSTTSSGADGSFAGPIGSFAAPASTSTRGSNFPLMRPLGSLDPSIAGSGTGSNSGPRSTPRSTPIADVHHLMRAGGKNISSDSGMDPQAVPGGTPSQHAQHTQHTQHTQHSPPGGSHGGESSKQQHTPMLATPFSGPTASRQHSAATSATDTSDLAVGPSMSELLPRMHTFPTRTTLAALSALSPKPLKAVLRHLHLSICIHLPPRFRVAALQCRATWDPMDDPSGPPTTLDLSKTLTQACFGPATAPLPTNAAHPIISTFALLLPSSVPTLRHLSLRENHLKAADAVALATAIPSLPFLQSLDLSNNSGLTAASVATLLCSCPNLRTSLTLLNLLGCSRTKPAFLSRALWNLDRLASLAFGPAPPRMGDTPALQSLAEPMSRLQSLQSLRLCGFGSALLDIVPLLPFETLTTLDVASEEDVIAPMHAALAAQAGRMRPMRRLLMQGWLCTTVDALSIDRFVRAIATLPQLEEITMSGAPPHNPDVNPLTAITTLTSVSFKNMSRHYIAPMVLHLPRLQHYHCIKCHSPPAATYQPVMSSMSVILQSLRFITLDHCDMDATARGVFYRHLLCANELRGLRIAYPVGGNLSYFPLISELTFLTGLAGLTRLEITCCHRWIPGSPKPALNLSNFPNLEILAVTVTDRSESPQPHALETSVFTGLGTLTALRSLDISHTAIADLPSFVQELAPCTRLTSLCLLDTAPPAAAQTHHWHGVALASRLARALSSHTGLEDLTLSFLPLGDAGAAMLAPAIGRMPRLQHLGMIKTGVSDVGAAALWLHLRALPLNRQVLINSATGPQARSGPSASSLSESVAAVQGHSGFPYPMM